MKNKTQFSMNIGLPSILLIFVVLCLVSFGVLSLVSANSDKKLSQKVLTRSASYYEICNQAEEMLADVQKQLSNAYFSCENETSYLEAIQDIPTSYIFPLSDLQNLQITLAFCYPTNDEDDFFKIKTWQVITADNLEYDEQLHVIP